MKSIQAQFAFPYLQVLRWCELIFGRHWALHHIIPHLFGHILKVQVVVYQGMLIRMLLINSFGLKSLNILQLTRLLWRKFKLVLHTINIFYIGFKAVWRCLYRLRFFDRLQLARFVDVALLVLYGLVPHHLLLLRVRQVYTREL